MKGSMKNRARGKIRQVKGKAKETVGRMRKNPELEGEGLDDQVFGKAQEVVGRIQKKLED
jgi:uncharacterized protein YjbJ (UPF0337 family)